LTVLKVRLGSPLTLVFQLNSGFESERDWGPALWLQTPDDLRIVSRLTLSRSGHDGRPAEAGANITARIEGG
jgi:hypothetical protein